MANPLLDDCSMHGAKGVLINITGGSDITLFEIDEAASRIKEEVDEDANIIFGSSFDETLEGKIRVSIVATGIGEGTVARPKAPQPVKYVEESFTEEKIVPQVPSPELDSNLEKFSATKTETSEDIQEIIDNVSIVSLESQTAPVEETVESKTASENRFEDFDMLDKSSVMAEMPKASALFKAIINKSDEVNPEAQLNSILSSNENVFTAHTTLKTVEEEPELFPDHNPSAFKAKRQEEPEELIINDDEEEYRPTLIERVTGFSIARRNKKKKMETERFQEPITPSFSDDDYQSEERVNLEIPSFLRRK